MTNRLELNWMLDGFVQELRYYFSESTIDVNNPPAAKLVLGGDVRSYVDYDIESGKTYYVRIGAVKNGIEKISDQTIVSTQQKDEFFQSVEILVFGDAETYPSYTLIDQSKNAHVFNSTTATQSQKVSIVDSTVTQPMFDDGSIKTNTSGSNQNVIINPIGTGDFTLEFYAKGTLAEGVIRIAHSATATGASGFNNLYFYNSGNAIGLGVNINGGGSSVISPITAYPISTAVWKHVCLMRKSATWYLFIDGVQVANTTSRANTNFNGTYFRIGCASNLYLNSIRLTRLARYDTSGFTPPDKKLPSA